MNKLFAMVVASEKTITKPKLHFAPVAVRDDGKVIQGMVVDSYSELIEIFQRAGFPTIPNTGDRFDLTDKQAEAFGMDLALLK
jgi:hypothetical protein